MWSFIFVTVCDHYEWKQICAGFSLFVYMYCCWRSSYQKSRVGIPSTSLTPPYFCACPKLRRGFPMLYIMVFCVQLLKVRGDWFFLGFFVDIRGFVDHHCLNFPFIKLYNTLCINKLLNK